MTSRILNLLISFVLFGIIALTLHEWAHYQVASLMGINGVVVYTNVTGGMFIPDPATPITHWFVYTSGGLVAAAFLFLIWLFGTHIGDPWDPDDAAAVFTVMMFQFFYGLAETSLFFNYPLFRILSPLSMLAGFAIGMIIYFPKLAEWWRQS